MPGLPEHLRQAERFEGSLTQINVPSQPYREWVVIVWFHIALHYVDAVLATHGHNQIANHGDRWAKMGMYDETRRLIEDFGRLYKEAKEARYLGGQYAPADLAAIERLYRAVRAPLRAALNLSP